MFDLRFKHPSTFIIAGSSQSGKTTFVLNLLHESDLIEGKNEIANILFYYKEWQPAYQSAKEDKIVTSFLNVVPSADDIRERVMYHTDKGGSIVIIDDYMQSINDDIVSLFTTMSHHLKITVFLLTQNLFAKSAGYRDISLNSTYIILMKNPRDSSQVSTFAKQFAPGKTKFITDVFREATRLPHSYLIFDNHQRTPDIIRVRSNIFPKEWPMKVWMEKTCNI